MFITHWLSASSPNLTISVWIILYMLIVFSILKLFDYALFVAFNFDKFEWNQLWTLSSNLALFGLASPILNLYLNNRIQMTIYGAIFLNMFLPTFLTLLPSKTIIEKTSSDEVLTDDVIMSKLKIINSEKQKAWKITQFGIGILISISLLILIYFYINQNPDNIKTFAKMFAHIMPS